MQNTGDSLVSRLALTWEGRLSCGAESSLWNLSHFPRETVSDVS